MPQMPDNIAVWFEIPVTDLENAQAFYETVLGFPTSRDDTGPNPLINLRGDEALNGVSGHLYPGTPAPRGTGNTIHVAVMGTLEDAIARVVPAGGEVVSPIITIPPGRFAYCLDPDGNSIGLFTR